VMGTGSVLSGRYRVVMSLEGGKARARSGLAVFIAVIAGLPGHYQCFGGGQAWL
jgi:hypothetical protein